MTEETAEPLAREAKNGSLQAFEELVGRFDRKIYTYCRYRVGHAEDARDLTQQTFIQAFRKLDKFRAGKPFSPWLYAIARNLCTDFLRLKRDSETLDGQDWIDPGNPADQVESADHRREIWTIVKDQMSESEFTTLWLVYQQGFNMKETADAMQKSVGATKVMLSRARQRLRSILRPKSLQNEPESPDQRIATQPNYPMAISQL